MRTQDRAFRCIETLAVMSGLAVFAVLAAILAPNFIRARARGGPTSSCKSNLKNIGTALEMYSTDHAGAYPRGLEQLVPNYLRFIPTCPEAETDTYSATYKTFNNLAVACIDHASQETDSGKCHRHRLALEQLMNGDSSLEEMAFACPVSGRPYRYRPTDYNYRYCCGGANHEDVDISADYPAYDSISGLQERP